MAKKKKGPLQRAKRTAKLTGGAMALGAIIGVAVGLLNAKKPGKELKSDLEREGQKLWKKLNKSKKDVEKVVNKVFGEVSPVTLKIYSKAKAEVLLRVAKGKDVMSKAKYEKIVDSVVKKVTKNKKYKKNLKKLSAEFKKTWKDLKDLI